MLKEKDIIGKKMQKLEMKKNTTNEENNPVIKREISRSGDNTYYRNN